MNDLFMLGIMLGLFLLMTGLLEDMHPTAPETLK